MRVLEVGCGDNAGPFFDGASEHIILDIDEEGVAIAASIDHRFTPMVADATNLHEFTDQSVDVILARNVFGSPLLGIEYRRMVKILHTGQGSPEYVAAEPEVDTRKRLIMQQAGRVLIAGGKFIIVERLTPQFAVKFFERQANNGMSWPVTLSLPELVDISNVAPPNYAEARGSGAASHKTWLLYRHN